MMFRYSMCGFYLFFKLRVDYNHGVDCGYRAEMSMPTNAFQKCPAQQTRNLFFGSNSFFGGSESYHVNAEKGKGG
jgi:hypothetical protein